MNIIMFCPQYRPLVGGAERQAEKLACALVRKGMTVTILTPRVDPISVEVENVGGVVIRRFVLHDLSRRWALPGIGFPNIPWILSQVARAVWPHLVDCNS